MWCIYTGYDNGERKWTFHSIWHCDIVAITRAYAQNDLNELIINDDAMTMRRMATFYVEHVERDDLIIHSPCMAGFHVNEYGKEELNDDHRFCYYWH